MSVDGDDEILQDFLVEADEILEGLDEQLVDLERRPDDQELLNAVFRGFHTVKGGAGFLGLTALVEVCHRAEDVFNLLRQGERTMDSQLMDVVLKVLDGVNAMLNQVRSGEEPSPADPGLLSDLDALARPVENDASAVAPGASAERDEPASNADEKHGAGDITHREFEALLDAVQADSDQPQSSETAAASGAASGDNNMADDEFEALLDHLHGKNKHSGVPASSAAVPEATALVSAASAPAPASSAGTQPGKQTAAAETSVRVDTRVLDDIMNLVGELVLARNRLHTLKAAMADEQAAKAVANLDVVTSDLQLVVMKTRMQAIKKVFGRFPRVVRDLAQSLGKEVALELQGEDTDLDKNLVEALADPLVHLVRNAVDHGIEDPEERLAAGKPRQGKVVLAACQEGDHIMLSICDDGRGMDAEVLRRQAIEKGMMDAAAAARLDNHNAYNLIFAPGFSTKSKISDVSGRGVGMDVVKTRIAQVNGTVEIESEMGKGSRIVIKVPLTLAIMPTLMVKLGSQVFALPLASVVEIFHLDLTRTNVVDGQLVILVRERALPLFYLRDWLVSGSPSGGTSETGHVVVVQAGRQQVGFVVDHLIGQEEVVIKPLGALLQGLHGMAGATITGDGKIALILDIPGMMRRYVH